MKRLILVLCLVLVSCGPKLTKVCDTVQKSYMIANAAAVALKPTLPPGTWQNCVVPLDHIANDAVVACYRAAASGSAQDIIAAIAATASIAVEDFSALKGCK